MLLTFVKTAEGFPILLGFAYNASDGTVPDGYTIAIWQTINGKGTNQTDTIGLTGGAAETNFWSIDCYEDPPTNSDDCDIGDNFSMEIQDNGSGYTSWVLYFNITNAVVQDVDPNITLVHNIPPNITIYNISNNSVVSDFTLVNASVVNISNFNVSVVEYAIANSSGNYTKNRVLGWTQMNESAIATFYNDTFNASIFSNGDYRLYVRSNNSKGAQNASFTVFTVSTPTFPDLLVNDSTIVFSDSSPSEVENITINATIFNIGGKNATGFNVSFFLGNYTLNNQIGSNIFVQNITSQNQKTVSVNWTTKLGTFDIFVTADSPVDTNGNITEADEANNVVSKSITILSTNIIVGNLTGSLILGDSTGASLIKWEVPNTTGSRIYVADADSSINFDSLWAIGKNLSNSTRLNDFTEIDFLLNNTNNTDSINSTYTTNSLVNQFFNFTVFSNILYNVSITNSTNSSQFYTGILWDSSDDGQNVTGTDGEFDDNDKEDIIFIANVVSPTIAKHGFYGFEVRVPANLRFYVKGGGTQSVSVYGEIR